MASPVFCWFVPELFEIGLKAFEDGSKGLRGTDVGGKGGLGVVGMVAEPTGRQRFSAGG
jgi:hypothetical protein